MTAAGTERRNEVVIDGRLLKRGVLRYTPAGSPAIDLVIGHRSKQIEGGHERDVQFEVGATAIGELALELRAAKLNRPLRLRGFLALSGSDGRKLNLRVTAVRALDGIEQV